MESLLSLPRALLLAFFFFIGPVALIAVISNHDNGRDGFWWALGTTLFTTYCFVRMFRGNTLKPSEQALNQSDLLKAKATEITLKASKATKDWAKDKLDEAEESRRIAELRKAYIQSVANRSACKPLEVVILGGAGWEGKKGCKFLLSLDQSAIYMSDLVSMQDSPLQIENLLEVDISGPGKVTSSAGVVGGGFGAEGAMKGIAVATVLNLLTTHSNTKTFIRLGFSDSEIVMLTSQIEPDAARILLSPLFLKIKRQLPETKPVLLSGELQKLHELKQSGAITDQEFDKLKTKLIG